MALEVRKKERETSQNLVHRFTKTVRRGGVLIEARKRQFHKRVKSDLANKKSAIRREESRIKYEKEKKFSKPTA
ncbi:MAG: hypothetical protein WC845_03215 [Candidatus Staskawiczbacteria bacterium]|jgi:hypothetical protein